MTLKKEKGQKNREIFLEGKRSSIQYGQKRIEKYAKNYLYHQILMSSSKIFVINQNNYFKQRKKKKKKKKTLLKKNTKDIILSGEWMK